MSTEDSITKMALVGISTIEVVYALNEAIGGLARILAETIAVGTPSAFSGEKIPEIRDLMNEVGRAFAAAELVLPK